MASNIPVNGGTSGGGGVAGVSSINTRTGDVTLSKTDVGLSNVDNTTDLLKPISTATQTALDGKVDEEVGKGLSANDYTNTDKSKLDGIAAGATANATDAQLRDRTTHTGEQAISTVTGLQTALDTKIDKVVSIDNRLVRFDGTSGAVQQSGVTVDDASNVNGVASLQVTGSTSSDKVTTATAMTLGPNADVYQNAEGSYGWRDNIAQFVVKGSGAADPSFGALFNGLEGYLFSATTLQRVFCDFHIDHDIARGTLIYPHVHWMPTTTGTGVVRWGIEYSVAKGHQQGAPSTFPATTTVYVNQTISAASQWQHFVAEVSLADAIPSTNIEPDSVIKVRVFRDAANAADTYTGAVHAWQADLHYQVARLSTVNKSPNFYG